MPGLRERYFSTLGFAPDEGPEERRRRLKAALTRAFDQRSFEIEHYWKRAAYFWGFEIAIFAGFGLLLSKDTNTHPLTVALAALGFLTALAHSLSARGSKFWQENWEHHIDMLEDEIEGRLYKTVWLIDGHTSFSVSRVNEALSDCFVVFWLIVASYVMWKFLNARPPPLPSCITLAQAYVFGLVTLLLLGIWRLWRKTQLRGTLPRQDGAHGDPISPAKFQSFARRYAPDEGPGS